MTQILTIHPENPQIRLLRQVVAVLQIGGVIAYPSDSGYALGCQIGNKDAAERIRAIRGLDKHHHFTLICRDLSELSKYAIVNNLVFRMLKTNTPGPYTFILPASKEVPRRLQHPNRSTIGMRIPNNIITQTLLAELGEPLMSVSLILPGEEQNLSDPQEIYEKLNNRIELIVDGGFCPYIPSTVINLTDEVPQLVRGHSDIMRVLQGFGGK